MVPEPRALLIDLDNCMQQLAQLPDALQSYSRVIACFGGAEPRVPLKLVPLFAAAISAGTLEIVSMPKKGKNAADFGLAFWAGRLVAELPANTSFAVLSRDADLDHVVELLKMAGRHAVRVSDAKPSIPASQPFISSREIDEAAGEYRSAVLDSVTSRPSKKAALRNSIKAHFTGRKSVDADDVLRAILAKGWATIDGCGRVKYGATVVEDVPF
ncbi:MAG: hypothetical protein HY901_17305 [Deltaproteobacteria bacterium]|nr:hypothetical protein [Deltaproteobacteria bacterium]